MVEDDDDALEPPDDEPPEDEPPDDEPPEDEPEDELLDEAEDSVFFAESDDELVDEDALEPPDESDDELSDDDAYRSLYQPPPFNWNDVSDISL